MGGIGIRIDDGIGRFLEPCWGRRARHTKGVLAFDKV
jgi:hypothetical protein